MNYKKMISGSSSGPIFGMLMVQLVSTGLQILSKMILTQGIFIFALIAYRHLLAAICIFPFAYYLERGSNIKLTLMAGVWVFLSSVSGIILGMGLFYYGLRDTTATYATNFLNLIPVVTFIFSLITRLEKLNLKTIKGIVRVIGTIFCLSGAIIISLYRGSLLVVGHESIKDAKIIKPDFKIGTIKLCTSILCYALWFIVQAKLLKEFPLKYWATMLTCLSASIQGAIVGVFLDRSSSAWKLGWNLQLVTIVYSGVLASAASFCMISWTVKSKGATFPAMFNPLALIFVAIIEVSALGQELRSGSLIGMLVIIVGLYAFLWGSGTGKKTKLTLPKSSNNEGETAKSSELARSQMSATVVPTASPISHVSQNDHEQSV
ncbi:WAT1-related protein At1g09380-like [Chenopodium quinoa]|uniref:WAT1-related protein At1g09380-like n=1 Tax=Chenopodium quinoa TaxID=63459 RepID=UPI000B796799|nr:WAT1-related protein At1g09380-like [Chenopodium quinoa]